MFPLEVPPREIRTSDDGSMLRLPPFNLLELRLYFVQMFP